MQKTLLIKCAIIGVLCLFFVLALTMISGLVYERKNYEQGVIDEIAQTQISAQTLTTPFVLTYDADKHKWTPIVPNMSEIAGNLAVKNGEYARGIYKATSYTAKLNIKQSYASFILGNDSPTNPNIKSVSTGKLPPELENAVNQANTKLSQPAPQPKPPSPKTYSLIIPVSDLRGATLPKVKVNGKEYAAKFATTQPNGLSNFMQVELGQVMPSDVAFSFELSGLTGLSVVPLGENSTVNLTGDWSEPKFYGDALPIQKTFNTTGFTAQWQNSFLAQQNNIVLKNNLNECQNCSMSGFNKISTDFVNTNNAYTKTDRTIKYALILLLVSFGTFFLFEVIKGLRIHPIQYLLVASGLLIFYVLLLSLSELIVFWQAYLVACVACVSLIGWYAFFVLKSFVRALIFGLILGGLYAGFYVILSAAEMNLLLGSVFCFVLLFAVMFITRNIDWYGIGDNDDNNDTYNNNDALTTA